MGGWESHVSVSVLSPQPSVIGADNQTNDKGPMTKDHSQKLKTLFLPEMYRFLVY